MADIVGVGVSRSSNQTINTGAGHVNISWENDNDIPDESTFWDSGDPTKWVADQAGWFMSTAHVLYQNFGDSANRYLTHRVNGATILSHSTSAGGSWDGLSQASCWLGYLNQNDYVQVTALQNSGSNLTLTGKGRFARLTNVSGAEVLRSSAQTISTGGSGTALSWDNPPIRDQIGAYNSGNPTRLTTDRSGPALILAYIDWDSNTTGERWLIIRVDGTTVKWTQCHYASGDGDIRQTVVVPIKLNAGQFVEVLAKQTSGADRTVTGRAAIVRHDNTWTGCEVTQSSGFVEAPSTDTLFVFDGEVYDDISAFDSGGTSTERKKLYALNAGWHYAFSQVDYNPATHGAELRAKINDATFLHTEACQVSPNIATNSTPSQTVALLHKYTANQFYGATYDQNSIGGALEPVSARSAFMRFNANPLAATARPGLGWIAPVVTSGGRG